MDIFTNHFSLCPAARRGEEMVVQEVLDEFVIYDLERHKAHFLNPTAARVWQWCDGQTPPAALAQQLAGHLNLSPEQAEPLLWLALDRLERANLLQAKVARPAAAQSITRRKALRQVGLAALLPVVYAMIAPTAAQAQTGGSPGCGGCSTACSSGQRCCVDPDTGTITCKNSNANCGSDTDCGIVP